MIYRDIGEVTIAARWTDPYSALITGLVDFNDMKRCVVHVIETTELTKEAMWIASAIAEKIERELNDGNQSEPDVSNQTEAAQEDGDRGDVSRDGCDQPDPGLPSLP